MDNLLLKRTSYSYRTETITLQKKTNKDKSNLYIKFVFFNGPDADC